MSRRPCLSSVSTWRTTNLHTSRVAKDQRRRERPFVRFTRPKIYPTSFTFTASFHVQDARGQQPVGSRQQNQGARISTRLFGDMHKRGEYCHDLGRKLAGVI